jgi:putative spermidine/putrescine transport system substrate-binding protein
MKRCLLLGLILFLAGGLLFAGGAPEKKEPDFLAMKWDDVVAAAKTEGSVTFYSWWGEEFWKTAASDFSTKYGIETRVIMGDLTANVGKVLAEKDKKTGSVDCMLIGGEGVKSTIDAGVFYGPINKLLPNYAKLDQKLATVQEGVATKGYLAPIYRNQTGFLYDPDKVKNPPQSWEDLVAWINANPKQFAFCDPTKGGSGQSFVQLVIDKTTGGLDKYKGDTALDPAKVANWNLAWDWFNKMKDKMVITASNNDSISRLNQGEVSLIIAWDDDTQVNLKSGSLFKRAKMYIPSMGLAGGGDSAGVLKNAPHKAAGLLFVSYLTEADVQVQMNELIGSYLARTDVQGKMALLPEEERQKNGVAWVPAPYKDYFKKEFVKNVLMK